MVTWRQTRLAAVDDLILHLSVQQSRTRIQRGCSDRWWCWRSPRRRRSPLPRRSMGRSRRSTATARARRARSALARGAPSSSLPSSPSRAPTGGGPEPSTHHAPPSTPPLLPPRLPSHQHAGRLRGGRIEYATEPSLSVNFFLVWRLDVRAHQPKEQGSDPRASCCPSISPLLSAGHF